jgi:hypothetical protein
VTSPSRTGVLLWMRLGRRGGGSGGEARWEGEGAAAGFKAQDWSRKSTEEEEAGGARAVSRCGITTEGRRRAVGIFFLRNEYGSCLCHLSVSTGMDQSEAREFSKHC